MPGSKIAHYFMLIALLLVVVSPMCRNETEIQGECTACGDLDILLGGNCYPKMRGCLTYALPGPTCSQCQSGYVLLTGKCVREGVINNNTNPGEIPPVVIDNSTLNYSEIEIRVGSPYASYFTDAHEQFLSTRPELGKGSIKNITRLDTKRGIFFIIIYESSINGARYQAVALLNTLNQTSIFSFKDAETQKKDPLTADIKVRSVLGSRLTNFFIYEVRFNSPNYTFYYMNSTFYVYEVKFNMNDLGSTNTSKFVSRALTAANLAKQQLLIKYPELVGVPVYSVRKMEDFYSFSFSNDITASVRFTNFRFEPNKPIKTTLDFPGFDIYDYFSGFFNAFYSSSAQDARYYACLNDAIEQAPELQTATVIYSSQTIVPFSAAISTSTSYDYYYYFSMYKYFNSDIYDIYSMYTHDNIPKTLYIEKYPSIILYSEKYNYNADALFFKSYINASIASKVLMIPAIESVMMKANGSGTNYFKVNYSPVEYMEYKYNKTSGVTTVISYTVEGFNILDILGAVGTTPEKFEDQLYLTYLETKKSVEPYKGLASFLYGVAETQLSFVTFNGTYKANVGSASNAWATTISQLSNLTCFNFAQVNQRDEKRLDNFLRSYYSLSGYTKRMCQSKVNKIGKFYRVLYSNAKLKQIEFVVEQLFTLFNVIKKTVYNDGYEYMDPVATNTDYQKIVTYLSSSTLSGTKQPLMVQSTARNIRGYYNDGRITHQILIQRATNSASVSVYEPAATDFSSCANRDTLNNKCLSCDPVTKVEYQGNCWNRMEGCKVQAGKNCLRCNDPYILADRKCKINCSELFPKYY